MALRPVLSGELLTIATVAGIGMYFDDAHQCLLLRGRFKDLVYEKSLEYSATFEEQKKELLEMVDTIHRIVSDSR